MSDNKPSDLDASRRDFLKTSGLSALALGAGAALGVAGNATASPGPQPSGGGLMQGQGSYKGPYNILFLLVDQERLFRPGELPVGFHLPGHERLMKAGTTFLNHRINSAVCTSSRSVIYTGRHIQQTKMFDNTNFPWIQSLSTEVPTVG